MILENSYYKLSLNDANGSLESFSKCGKEFIEKGAEKRPLFTIGFRDVAGKTVEVNALEAEDIFLELEQEHSAEVNTVGICFKRLRGMNIDIFVSVMCPIKSPLTYWNMKVLNDTDLFIEWISFPNVVVPNDLIATGGDGRILWSAMEGSLIEDADKRENNDWLRYKPMKYPSRGWEGYYPGPCPTQLMAYYGDGGGLYLGAHDSEWNVKSIEFYKYQGGISLDFRMYPEAASGTYEMKYDMVLGVFDGDWHDAAEIYRDWYESTISPKPLKLLENYRLPNWLNESPVVVTYPVRGKKDTGDMTPNEYYPYANALPIIERLSKELDSKILVLLMHWEGTAPWAPPYVWPPLGGEEKLKDFISGLHKEGNLLGVYCSGIAWTNESTLLPEYNRKEQFNKENLSKIMCTSPEGELPNSLICNGPIRWGYDMCPENSFVEEVVVSEVAKILESGCDYIQYFDQNLGGINYLCYGKNHGHPPGPGKWQVDAMIRIFRRLQEVIDASGQKTVLGCEAAAAEPFLSHLPFNDLRFNINFFIGKPIPLYSYLYHEYVNNFMGNQNCSCQAINVKESPENMLYRIAYSFSAGDMLTVVLKGGGEIHWDWGTDWEIPAPDQQQVKKLIKNLNALRKGYAKTFLRFGRMLKPHHIEGSYDIRIALNEGGYMVVPSLLTSRWLSPDGKEAQIVVNYTTKNQDFFLCGTRWSAGPLNALLIE